MTERPLEYLAPRSPLSDEQIAHLRSGLDGREDVVAAYYLTTRYPDPVVLQDELHFELADAPDDHAPPALVRAFADVVPSGVAYTFPRRSMLARVRAAGLLLWSRAESG